MRRDRISPCRSVALQRARLGIARAPWVAALALLLGAATAQGAPTFDDKRPQDAINMTMASASLNGAATAAIDPHGHECNDAYDRALQLWHGGGRREDADEILAQLRRAAEHGHLQSQNLLGRFHDKGRLVPHDDAEAVKWYEKAAHQGLASAQLNAGLMYRAGNGVQRDQARAFFWLEQAARQDAPEAQYLVAMMLEEGDGAERDVPAALRWYAQAAEQGYAPAQHNLAVAYATGEGGSRNERAAVKWYRKAAAAGQPLSQLQLARALAEGQGARRDEVAAYVWARVAAANGWGNQALRLAADELAAGLARMLSPSQLEKAARDIEVELKRRG